MSGAGDWPGEETAETRVMALPAQEREILAALAVVGRASLSHEELAELLRVDDVTPLVSDLQARGLVRSDERRCSAAGRIGEEIRRTNDALSTGDRLMGYVSTLAQSGRLTPGRLADDSAAILGLSEWAAEMQRSAQLLEMVKTVEASYEIAQRAEEWRELLLRGRGAAHALGDRQSEIWMLQRLATAAAMAGDSAGAQQYLREADELQRTPQPTPMTEQASPAGGDSGNTWKIVLVILGTVLVALIGVGVGYAIGHGNKGSAGTTTITRTLEKTGTETTTTTETVPTTVISTTTVTTTVTTGGAIP
ncbi:MAG TPA: hypothetical protein VLU96_10780 [Gaiellaceae bacterium]|nr:hypothetical protein [Gaiellaceae bacterium]